MKVEHTTAISNDAQRLRKDMAQADCALQPLSKIQRRTATIAQQIKDIIAAPQWTAEDLQTLLPKPEIRVLSQWDFRDDVGASDLAWAAGFFDGEGCISIIRQRYTDPSRQPTYRLKLYVSQVNKRSLEEFEWAVGLKGRIVEQKAKGRSRRSCYHLTYEGLASVVILRRLQPFLRRKGEQCAIALDFQRDCEVHTHFGPKGCPQEIWELRRGYFNRMQTIKGDH